MTYKVDGEQIAAGGPKDRLLPWYRVQEVAGFSRSTAWRMQRTGQFPRPVRISPGRVGWWESELTAWKATCGGAIPAPRQRETAKAPRLPGMARSMPALKAVQPPTGSGPPPIQSSLELAAVETSTPPRKRARARPAAPDQIDFGF